MEFRCRSLFKNVRFYILLCNKAALMMLKFMGTQCADRSQHALICAPDIYVPKWICQKWSFCLQLSSFFRK